MIGLGAELLNLGTKKNTVFYFKKRLILDIIYYLVVDIIYTEKTTSSAPHSQASQRLWQQRRAAPLCPLFLTSTRGTPKAHIYLLARPELTSF